MFEYKVSKRLKITDLVILSGLFLVLSFVNVRAEPIEAIGGDFVLQSADGDVALKDLRGKVVLLYFGYTNCPDACPTTLQQWTRAFKKLQPQELSRVQGLMVSVDPERDSVKTLKAYVGFFHKNIMGVTGTPENLHRVNALFGTKFEIEKHEIGKGYGVGHSARVFVIDPDGKARNRVDFTFGADELVELIRQRLGAERK